MLINTRQIKAARSLIGWRQFELAEQSGVGISTIRRLEGAEGRIEAHFDTIEKLRLAFERAGIEFLGRLNPGVRLWQELNSD
ncbi:transcriptional regulator [Bradyrhizobium sp. KBS0727]|nr:transcriptional regulator [Bradyrhizobium sp. KBS0725]QDW47162.1 transcriptional regulator [Bradyrhizobium sp. KBS0727]